MRPDGGRDGASSSLQLFSFVPIHNSIHWHVLSQEVGCCGHLPTLLPLRFPVFYERYSPFSWNPYLVWFHCRVPLNDSRRSDRDPMESVGLASQAGRVPSYHFIDTETDKSRQCNRLASIATFLVSRLASGLDHNLLSSNPVRGGRGFDPRRPLFFNVLDRCQWKSVRDLEQRRAGRDILLFG